MKHFYFFTLFMLAMVLTTIGQNARFEISGWSCETWDDQSHNVYLRNTEIISETNPFWYNLGSAIEGEGRYDIDGGIYERDVYDAAKITEIGDNNDLCIVAIGDARYRAEKSNGEVDPRYYENKGRGQINKIFANPTARQNLINNLVNTAVNRGYDGWDLDFEWGYQDTHDPNSSVLYAAFVNDLAESLAVENKVLDITIRTFETAEYENEEFFDLDALKDAPVHRIKLMLYDGETFRVGEQVGPVADIRWVKACLDYMIGVRGLPAEKVVMGIPNYGWTWKDGNIDWKFRTYDYIMSQPNIAVTWDDDAKELYAEWTKDESNYQAYFANKESVEARMELVDQYGLAGVAFWVFGQEDQDIYDMIYENYYTDPKISVTGISFPSPSKVMYYGDTEQLSVNFSPANATRKGVFWSSDNENVATVSETGLITTIKVGDATISATTVDGKKIAQTVITVLSDEPNNISYNKPATASSIEGNSSARAASNVVDGNTSTRWASVEKEDPQWITIDLGAKYNIDRVKIYWEGAYASDYKIQVSPDNASWTTLKTITGNTTLTNDFANLSGLGNFIRIYGTARVTEWGYSIFELKVYGTPVNYNLVTELIVSPEADEIIINETKQLSVEVLPSNATNKTVTWSSGNTAVATVNANGLVTAVSAGTAQITATSNDNSDISDASTITVIEIPSGNLALNKPVSVSSTEYHTLGASNAVDGDSDTRWSSLYSDPEWISVDLGTNYAINRVKLTWAWNSTADYDIQVSTDNVSWTTIKSVSGNTTTVNDNTGLSGTGRYVRIYCTARLSEWGHSIYELEVYGSSSNTSTQKSVALGNTKLEQDNSNILVYPNPAFDDKVKVKLTGYSGENTISIIDFSGKVIVSEKVAVEGNHEFTLNVESLKSGIYIISVRGAKGFKNMKMIKR